MALLTRPLLSIIFPALNEEIRLPAALEQTTAFLNSQSYTSEIIVVDSGSSDHTLEIANRFASQHANLKVVHENQRGKGRAVRAGMLVASGEYRMFCDVDLSMPIGEVNRFIPPALSGVDVSIASREAPGAVRYGEPAYRHFIGRGFNFLVRLFALPGLADSQCGFKCFRGSVADELFPLMTITGWTFDVEVLFIARRRGYRIAEVPIPWYYNAHGKIRVVRDSVQMFLDLWAIRRNAARGLYR
jgi:dolichyl-phosphate beta-glucosyltransferase